MSDTFSTFPSNKFSALAMLYVEQHSSLDLTPEQLLDMYDNVYERIREHSKSKHSKQTFSF